MDKKQVKQEQTRQDAISGIEAGVVASENGIYDNIYRLTKGVTTPQNRGQLGHKLLKIAYHDRGINNYQSSKSYAPFSFRKIQNDARNHTKTINRILKQSATKKLDDELNPNSKVPFNRRDVKSLREQLGFRGEDGSHINVYGTKTMTRFQEIGELQNNITKKLFYSQEIANSKKLPTDVLQSSAKEIQKDNHDYAKILRKINPDAYLHQSLKQIRKQNHTKHLQNKWQAKENKTLATRKQKEVKKFKQVRNGQLVKPILNASQIRSKAQQARKHLTGSQKSKMTRLITLTKKNPYLHRFASKWNRKNYEPTVNTQRKINLLHKYLKAHPKDSFIKKDDLLYDRTNTKHYFGQSLQYGYRSIKDLYKFHPTNKWHQLAQNIDDSSFYTNQVKHIKKAYRDAKHGKYTWGAGKPTPENEYIGQGQAGNPAFNVDASKSSWQRFNKLTTKAKMNNFVQHHNTHSFTPHQSTQTKAVKHSQFGKNPISSAERIIKNSRNGRQR